MCEENGKELKEEMLIATTTLSQMAANLESQITVRLDKITSDLNSILQSKQREKSDL